MYLELVTHQSLPVALEVHGMGDTDMVTSPVRWCRSSGLSASPASVPEWVFSNPRCLELMVSRALVNRRYKISAPKYVTLSSFTTIMHRSSSWQPRYWTDFRGETECRRWTCNVGTRAMQLSNMSTLVSESLYLSCREAGLFLTSEIGRGGPCLPWSYYSRRWSYA